MTISKITCKRCPAYLIDVSQTDDRIDFWCDNCKIGFARSDFKYIIAKEVKTDPITISLPVVHLGLSIEIKANRKIIIEQRATKNFKD